VCRSRAGLTALALLLGSEAACNVFPDQAVLPLSDAPGGAAGSPISAAASGGSSGAVGGRLELAGEAGAQSAGAAQGGAAEGGAGGAPVQVAGSDSGGAVNCPTSHLLAVPTDDTWVDAAEPQVNHGSDVQLFLLGGASEQRVLLCFALPKLKAGDSFVSATLALTLSQKPNLGTDSRVLDVYALSTATFKEGRVTWLNYGNGAAKRWATPGGDFGAGFGTGSLQASTSVVRLDASALAAAAYASQQTGLGLLVRDPETSPVEGIHFAFASKEGSAASIPVLDIEYCGP